MTQAVFDKTPKDRKLPVMTQRRSWTLYRAGFVITALFALAHLSGFVMAARAARTDPALREVTALMRRHTSPLMGFTPSLLDFREYFSLNFSILLMAIAGFGAVLGPVVRDSPQLLRRVSSVAAIGMLALLASSIGYGVVQGMVTAALLAIIFGSAATVGRGQPQS